KFIERTAEIEAHRGIHADDGIVRVEYQAESVRPIIPAPRYEPWYYPYPRPHWTLDQYGTHTSIRGMTASNSASAASGSVTDTSSGFVHDSFTKSDAGITVQ